jgi:hypothetical protein
MKIHCESLDHTFELTDQPRHVISLVAAATKTLFAMGCGDRAAGVSCYCDRYIPDLKVIESTVARGQNPIQEGPSILETAPWLQNRMYGRSDAP